MESISVLLVDDNPTFLRATKQFLEAHDGIAIVGTANEGASALAQAPDLQPRVILVDLAMVGLSGLEVIPRLRSMLPQAGIIALTLMNTSNFRQAALKAGADDFIPKATMRSDLVPAIQRVTQGSQKRATQPVEAASDNGSTATPRLLIMEDNAHLRRLYSKALRRTGFEVHTAETTQRAQELLDNTRFDVLLCDINMGRDRGTDLLREYAERLATSGTRVIMVSGEAQYRDICEEMGVDFFLEKPVAISTLVTLLSRLAAQ